MADNTGIEWTDATVNFWWGCTKVGPGCDNCYAEKWSRRTGGSHWGVGVPRRKIKGAVALLHRLDNGYSRWAADYRAAEGNARALDIPAPTWGLRRRVFVQSMSDLFDLEVPVEWFAEAWKTIKACDRIDIQIVTKRVSAVRKRLAEIGETEWPRHAGLLISVVNQPEADRDVPRLLDLKDTLGIPWVGLSMEPLLGPVDLTRIDPRIYAATVNALTGVWRWDGGPSRKEWPGLDWVIVGGESGPDARPMHPDWAEALRRQCQEAGVAFFFKQWGEWAPFAGHPLEHESAITGTCRSATFPDGTIMVRVGKARSGRALNGVLHDAVPALSGGSP